MCVAHRYPLSDALETHRQTHTDANNPSPLHRSNPPRACGCRSIDDLSMCARSYTHIYIYTHTSAASPLTIHDQEELPSTDTATANIEFALTSREHAGRSIRLVWYPRNFASGYEGKLDALHPLAHASGFLSLSSANVVRECSLLWPRGT